MCDNNDDEMSRHDNDSTTTTSSNLDIAMVASDQDIQQNDYDTLLSFEIMNSNKSDTETVQNQNMNDGMEAVATNNDVMIRNSENIPELLQYKHQAQEESSKDTMTNCHQKYCPTDIETKKRLTTEIIPDNK